ncbi:MAG TPA: hypothetical protein PLP19_03265 [bacterium]|nr:hypothetical protein [bacterium]HPN42488.1 hypothetical protein [bacterium]
MREKVQPNSPQIRHIPGQVKSYRIFFKADPYPRWTTLIFYRATGTTYRLDLG